MAKIINSRDANYDGEKVTVHTYDGKPSAKQLQETPWTEYETTPKGELNPMYEYRGGTNTDTTPAVARAQIPILLFALLVFGGMGWLLFPLNEICGWIFYGIALVIAASIVEAVTLK